MNRYLTNNALPALEPLEYHWHTTADPGEVTNYMCDVGDYQFYIRESDGSLRAEILHANYASKYLSIAPHFTIEMIKKHMEKLFEEEIR